MSTFVNSFMKKITPKFGGSSLAAGRSMVVSRTTSAVAAGGSSGLNRKFSTSVEEAKRFSSGIQDLHNEFKVQHNSQNAGPSPTPHFSPKPRAYNPRQYAPSIISSQSDVDAWANDPSQKIVPKWWTGENAHDMKKIQVDCGKMNLKSYLIPDEDGTLQLDMGVKLVEDLQARMKQIFNDEGLVYAVNTGMDNALEMRAVMKLANPDSIVYEAGANNRGYISEETQQVNVYETGAPLTADIHYHHEMAYIGNSTSWLGFMCLDGCFNPQKGVSFIANGPKVTEELMATDLGQKLKEKGVCYVRKLPDQKYFIDNNLDKSIVYNYWQTSMGTEDPAEAQAIAEKNGLHVEWQDSPVFGRYMVTKYYVDTFEYDPYTETNQLYASVADDYMWFDSWPGVVDLPHHERPLKLNFGDDEVMTREEKELFVDVYDRHGTMIPWKKGDLAIICNYRTAHGRPGFELLPGEKRELGVMLGSTYERQGARADKW